MALVLAVLFALLFSIRNGEEASSSPPRDAVSENASPPESASGADSVHAVAERQSVSAAQPTQSSQTAPTSTPKLTVRTVTIEREVLVGCQLVLRLPQVGRSSLVDERCMLEVEPGVHVVEGLPAGEYDLFCGTPSLRERLCAISFAADDNQELVVPVAARSDVLGGILRTARGDPVVGAMVADASRTTRADYCLTDRNGRFLFSRRADAAAAAATLRITDVTGEAGIADVRDLVQVPWGELERIVIAEPRGEVVVRLFDEAGAAVQSFEVELQAATELGVVSRMQSARDGIARVDRVPSGEAEVLVVPASEHRPVRARCAVGSDGRATVDLMCTAGVPFVGTVRSARGEPIGQAVAYLREVGVHGVGDEAQEFDGVVSSPPEKAQAPSIRREIVDARFAFVCDPAVGYRIRIEAPGHLRFEHVVEAKSGSFAALDVQLQPSHVVRFRMEPPEALDWLRRYASQSSAVEQREGPRFLLAETNPSGGQKPQRRFATPGSDGRVEFEDLAPGTWLLRVNGPLQWDLLATVELRDQRLVELPPQSLAFLRPGRLELDLRTESDVRLRSVSLLLAGSRVDVAADASATTAVEVPAGGYQLRVAGENAAGPFTVGFASVFEVRAGETSRATLRVAVERLRIQLVDNQTGRPIPNATVAVEEDRLAGAWQQFVTDVEGFVEIHPRPIGDFGLSVRDEGTRKWTVASRITVAATSPWVVRFAR